MEKIAAEEAEAVSTISAQKKTLSQTTDSEGLMDDDDDYDNLVS